MVNSKQSNWILGAAVTFALSAGPVMAADNMNTAGDRARDKGVPGVDVDVKTGRDAREPASRNGVPGVDVDVNRTTKVHGDDTRMAPRGDGKIMESTRTDAMQQVQEAGEVLAKMKRDPDLAAEMARAKGILISPDYGRAGLVVGAHGGNGVLLVRHNNGWTGPALYNLGGVSIGAQAGASGGQRALLLMSDKAVNQFKQANKFALNADAGLTVIAWSAKAQARTGGDVIAWSDQVGAYAGATIGVSDVNFDERETAALYGKQMTASDIITGKAKAPESVKIAGMMPSKR